MKEMKWKDTEKNDTELMSMLQLTFATSTHIYLTFMIKSYKMIEDTRM